MTKGRRLGTQHGAKIGAKTRAKFKKEIVAFWGPTWVDLGRFLGGYWETCLLIFYWFSYYFVKIDVFNVKTIPRRFGDEIWPKMTPSWAPKRAQIGPKSGPKRDQILDGFLIDFWAFLGRENA